MDEYAVPQCYQVKDTDTAFDDIFANAAAYPDHIAVSRAAGSDWAPVTCRALAADVNALAAGLIAAGISAGDRVAVMSRTRYEWMIADFAIMSTGAITVPIYETSSDSQITWILRDSGAVALFVEDAEASSRIERLRTDAPELRWVWTLDDDVSRLGEAALLSDRKLLSDRRSAVRSHDLASIVYTSGTTGRPKGCMLTHANLVATVRNVTAADGLSELVFAPTESTLLFLPLAHILARIIQCGALHNRVRLAHLADMKAVAEGLQSFRPTVVLSVPRVFEKVHATAQRKASSGLAHLIFNAADRAAVGYSKAMETPGGPGIERRVPHALFDHLVYRKIHAAMGGGVRWAVSGGAPLGAQLGHFFRGVGLNVLEGYGLTETTAGGTLNLPSAQRVGSVGRPIPGCTIHVAGDGELLMKGPHVFAGYWQNSAATAEVLDEEGWFHTGDIGRIDDDGFVYITDRKKDIIVTSAGKNVAPTVLEDVLRSHWLISQAAVFGDRRPFVSALLTLDGEATLIWTEERGLGELTPDVLTRHPALLEELQHAVDSANASVSKAEAIKKWLVLPTDFTEAAGELTPTLKLRRHVIASEFASEVESLYAGAK